MTENMLEKLKRLARFCQQEGISINAMYESEYGGIYLGKNNGEHEDFDYTLGNNYFTIYNDAYEEEHISLEQ